MSQADSRRPNDVAPEHSGIGSGQPRKDGTPASRAFYGMLDSLIVQGPVQVAYDGALLREHADSIWTWIRRDAAADLFDPNIADADPAAVTAFEAVLPQLVDRVRETLANAEASADSGRRLKAQLGGEEAWKRLPFVLTGLKSRNLLEKARTFGRKINTLAEEGAVVAALQNVPMRDPVAAAMVMQTAIGQVTNPSRLVIAAIRIAGNASEPAIKRANFGPLIDAILAHAQDQLHVFSPAGSYADIDLTCRSIDRFHRLLRAVHAFVEVERNSQWALAVAAFTKTASERIGPRIGEVLPDVNQSLRRSREGEKADPYRLLAGLNGMHLLATVRDCRDSLAVNAVFDQAWAQVGEALEVHIPRNLEILRAHPGDAGSSERLEAGIKMAELRFNAEYAEVLRRARDAADRRTPPPAS